MVSYAYGTDTVSFSGADPSITFGDHTFPVSWEIFSISNGKLQLMKMNKFQVRRIVDSSQNSAVLIEENSEVKVAEIFSFTPSGSIEANIALKNLGKQNETYLVAFSTETQKHATAVTGGYSGEVTANVGSQSDVSIIPASDTFLQVGDLQINWQQSMSIFHMGSIFQNGLSNLITLPFGTFVVGANDTYSIDPTLSYVGYATPERITCPTCGGGDSSFPVGTSSYIYDSSGNEIGLISQSTDAQSEYEATLYFGPTVAVSFSPKSSSSWTVNSYVQDYCWLGNSAGSGYEMYMNILDNYYQNHVKDYIAQMQTVLTMVTDIANAIGFPIPDLAYFLEYSSGITTSTLQYGIQTSANAGMSFITCSNEYYYNTLGYYDGPWYFPWSSFQDSFLFGELLQNEFTDTSVGGTQNNPVVNYFEYSVTMSVSNGQIDGPLYTGSSTLFFNIGQYNP